MAASADDLHCRDSDFYVCITITWGRDRGGIWREKGKQRTSATNAVNTYSKRTNLDSCL